MAVSMCLTSMKLAGPPRTSQKVSLSSKRVIAPHNARLRYRSGSVSCARRALAVDARYVLTPNGDGSCDHLPEDYPLTGEIELTGAEVTVGRDAPAEIVIPIPTVSGNHCQIAMVDDEFYIMDLSSTNGTFVNGKQLTPAKPEKLLVGSELIFGDEFLARFELREIP
mmetsp:Transcript_44400/g.74033  ORF Transcript_44400/g.74033 Transcript_44400/m.74033 type:complete len:167 (-) Transcript_44400:161-661(-)|eukprot:CAMPEP_0198210644 /NCGR_PEP_ID=MMETSP1445-20131203/21372_1 /TAXON_ID=36898 /ORGANISM="Pyramimonas sp., Strain CCMP2087" /LENGTH=166 /DNA_ID=CAMNT_0043884759 /DNA_START=112 /DNA_END=612 /DNA_ORIENTATION=+